MFATVKDKVVVITGASSGIGLETARALARKGARLVMVVRSEARGNDAIAAIRADVPDARMELVLADLYSLAAARITSNALHPGGVASNFGASGSWLFKYGTKLARPFLLTTEQGARTSVYLASSPDVDGVTGEYFAKCKIATPSRRARDDD